MKTDEIKLPRLITDRAQAYLDTCLDPSEHDDFITWARRIGGYNEEAALALDSEWYRGAVAGWQARTELNRQQRGEPVELPITRLSSHDVAGVLLDIGISERKAVGSLFEYCKFADALLARYGHPVAPEGWQLVPVEPTDDMALAACRVGLRNPAINGVAQYKAMLAAAPIFGEEE